MIDVIARRTCPGWEEAERHLARADPILGDIIARVGPCTLAPRKDYFAALCHSIISQQISTAAAQTVWERLRRLFPNRRPTAAALLALPPDILRSAGLSRPKQSYLRSIAEAFVNGDVPVRRWGTMDDEAIVQSLIPIRGIGRWTAEMFLIFVLNRTDLLPVDDLGLCTQVRKCYGLKDYPNADVLKRIAEKWRPYRSIATWYLWRGALKVR